MYPYLWTKDMVEELAEKMLDLMADDALLMGKGRRNDDSVNLMICCKILGEDYDKWVGENVDDPEDLEEWVEHRDRIERYIDYWCEDGREWEGWSYMINTPSFAEAKKFVEDNR